MKRIFTSIIAGTLIMGAAHAAPSSGLEQAGRTLSDQEMDEQRGKFVAADGIRYFGLEMQTRWTDANGVTTAATLVFTLNFEGFDGSAGSAVPVLMAGFTRSDGDAAAPASATGAPGTDALPDTQGALQLVSIAGSRNAVRNGMTISVQPTATVNGPATDGLSPLSGTQHVDFDDGDQLRFLVAPGEIGLLMTGGLSDSSVQSFGGDSGQAAQMVSLSSDDNAIANNMNMIIGQDRIGHLTGQSVGNSLISLQGL